VGENSIRPIALWRKNWLFAGSLPAGKRAANIMSLIETAKFNGHDPWAYLNDILIYWQSCPLGHIVASMNFYLIIDLLVILKRFN
jgi:hypothetical protein